MQLLSLTRDADVNDSSLGGIACATRVSAQASKRYVSEGLEAGRHMVNISIHA